MKMAGSNKEIPFPHLALELSPVTAQEHKIEGTTVEHTIVEVIPERKSQQSLYVTNVYSPPRDQLTDFDHFIRELRKRTRGPRLVVVGDFNAPHTAWGYAITTKKGARVHDVAQQHGLTLWNDPLQPTRVANSISRDTKPDLTFTRDFKKAGWTCLPETLGSDHHIIQLDIGLTHNYEGSEEDLLRELCNKLRGPVQSATIPPPPKEYEGIPNADPDRPFTPAELQVAISKLTRNTSPGKDRIVNKRLRQLPNHALTASYGTTTSAGKRENFLPHPCVTLHGVQIRKIASLRVLGLHLHRDGSGATALPRLQHTIFQLTHLVRRVANDAVV
ncbi:hypothetical protein HPB52_024682 [Rhipicephalus sanguineus]|uniref:Endonuclease/exonuclease/phosphatase domain-containing protein n=1 Tax=Rhipicephalus sanguineus TaxID=34632 RepID=A0A9D4TE17_RHISA|nr:hypothetical protein HPB52_024682 [Rhipicephalus sanguineus]